MKKFALVAALLLALTACSDPPAKVTITSKDGDSCLMENKCKMIVRVWEKAANVYDSKDGANIFYRCLVPNSFYEIVALEDKVVMNLDSKSCERLNP